MLVFAAVTAVAAAAALGGSPTSIESSVSHLESDIKSLLGQAVSLEEEETPAVMYITKENGDSMTLQGSIDESYQGTFTTQSDVDVSEVIAHIDSDDKITFSPSSHSINSIEVWNSDGPSSYYRVKWDGDHYKLGERLGEDEIKAKESLRKRLWEKYNQRHNQYQQATLTAEERVVKQKARIEAHIAARKKNHAGNDPSNPSNNNNGEGGEDEDGTPKN